MHMAKRRTSILVDKATYELYEARARRHGTTVSNEMRRVLDEAVCDENPNQAFIELMEDMAKYDWKPGPPYGSQEAEEQMVRDMYRDNLGREPDW
jgi:plasmid stability protein